MAQEVYPAVLGNTLKFWHKSIKNLILSVDTIVVINSYGQTYYKDHHNVIMLRNYATKFSTSDVIKGANLDYSYYIYAGNLGQLLNYDLYFGMSTFLEENNQKMLFVGDGIKRKWLVKEISRNPLIEYLPYQNRESVSHLLRNSLGSIIFLKQEALLYGFPSKIQELRLNGIKILSNYESGDALYMEYNNCNGIYSVELNELDTFKNFDQTITAEELEISDWLSRWHEILIK